MLRVTDPRSASAPAAPGTLHPWFSHCRLGIAWRAGKAGTCPRSPKPRRTLDCGGTTPLLVHLQQAQDAVEFTLTRACPKTICSAHFVASLCRTLCRTVRFLAIFDKVGRT